MRDENIHSLLPTADGVLQCVMGERDMLRKENDQLRAELAAIELTRRADESESLRQQLDAVKAELESIRDAGDEEIDFDVIEFGLMHGAELKEETAWNLLNIAKARGLKIKEQAAELKSVANERASYWAIYGDLQKVKTERDEAIGLLKWLNDKSWIVNGTVHNLVNSGYAKAKRILELTAKREEK